MSTKGIKYPQYRKYPHGRTYFKILSETEFEELELRGDLWKVHRYLAKTLPDRNYIYDLCFDYQKNWEKITEAEYLEKRAMCL